jgi:Lrp/AsnC family transcriptional regulator of ectoine degradation
MAQQRKDEMHRYHRKLARLDRLDLKIITALLREGRISKVQLSDQVGLSATPCWERIKKLEKIGIIRGYHADIDMSRFTNISYFRVEVTLNNYSMAAADRFERTVRAMPEAIECEAVLGGLDYVLKLAAASIESYRELMENLLSEDGLDFDFRTFPITKSVKMLGDGSAIDLIEAMDI